MFWISRVSVSHAEWHCGRASKDALQVEFRLRIVDAYLAGGVTQDDVAERFAVSKRSVQKSLTQWRETGALEPLGHGGGRPRVVQGELESWDPA